MENAYIDYYTIQIGSGLADIGPLYHNLRFVQQGRGFGSFFEALFRYLKPIVRSGVNALKDSAFKAGGNILHELGSRPLDEILFDNGKKFGHDLTTKLGKKFQGGSGLIFAGAAKRKHDFKGIKAKKLKKSAQSSTKRKKVKPTKKTINKKKKRSKINQSRILDIFSQ